MNRDAVRIGLGVLLTAFAAVGGTQPNQNVDLPVLPASLGSLHHPISTSNPQAQTLMDRGLTLYYGFNRDAARRSFAAAARADPQAAMPWVGLALALGPNINMDPTPNEIRDACDAARRATTLAKHEEERRYAAALTVRYCNQSGGDLNARSYAEAMDALHRALPQDVDAAVLYADSLLALRPRTVDHDAEIVSLLESVLHRQPEHVGANHYYIHAVEGTSTPERGLASARRLETLVPGVGHLLHMPSHIYMRTGDYDASIIGNRRAADADLAYLRANPPGADGAMYYLHDLESLAVAAGFAGRFAEARLAALEIARVEEGLAGGSSPRFSAPLAMVLLRFQRWADVDALPVPETGDLSASFLSHFGRAIAFAARRQFEEARIEADAFSRAAAAIPAGTHYRGNPIEYIRLVFDAVLKARLAEGTEPATAVAAWERAVDAQDRLEYHEPPPFYYPLRESLGAALIAAGRHEDAEHVFRTELSQYPRSGRALFGLWQALRARRINPEAERVHRAFLQAWSHSDVRLSLTNY